MISYNKDEIKEQLDLDCIFQLLEEWGGDPEYTSFGIISATICHNSPGEGSRKLYYYTNSGLFQCYTGCQGYFDVFELTRKIASIQWSEEYDLNDAVRWIAKRFGISGTIEDGGSSDDIEDWKLLANYDRIQEVEPKAKASIILKEYDTDILQRFNYDVAIEPWLREGISQDALRAAQIGFYPGNDQITIPHFDKDGRFIGLRGRTLCKEEAEMWGKYRPMKVNHQMYNHPLGLSIYGLNWSKVGISNFKKAIIFESEKSVLKYISYFGFENNIAVACCGSNISQTQIDLLTGAGAEEIIVAFDKQYKEVGDLEYKQWTKKLQKIGQKYKNYVNLSFILDIENVLGYKDAPIDKKPEDFLYLYKNGRFNAYGEKI